MEAAIIDKRLKRVELKEFAGISSSTLAKLGKEDYVSMEIMERIYTAFNVDIGNVMEFTSKNENGNQQ